MVSANAPEFIGLASDQPMVVVKSMVGRVYCFEISGVSMTSHPYISGAGNISQMIGFLRKNFPATVNSDTVKKLGVASNNESYVINALQFLGIIDEEGKRTAKGHEVLATHEEDAF